MRRSAEFVIQHMMTLNRFASARVLFTGRFAEQHHLDLTETDYPFRVSCRSRIVCLMPNETYLPTEYRDMSRVGRPRPAAEPTGKSRRGPVQLVSRPFLRGGHS